MCVCECVFVCKGDWLLYGNLPHKWRNFLFHTNPEIIQEIRKTKHSQYKGNILKLWEKMYSKHIHYPNICYITLNIFKIKEGKETNC